MDKFGVSREIAISKHTMHKVKWRHSNLWFSML